MIEEGEAPSLDNNRFKPYLASIVMDSLYYIFDFSGVRCGGVRVVSSIFASVHIRTWSLCERKRSLQRLLSDPAAVHLIVARL